MSLQHELCLPNPLKNRAQEALLNVALTGTLLAKEGDRLLRPLGLTDAQLNVLMLLKYQSDGGQLSQTRLGCMLLVNRANVTGLVDRMEEAGWVERAPDAEDRRVNQVRLTVVGRRILERAEKVYIARVKEVMGVLSNNEHKALCRMLERVRGHLRGTQET